MSSNTPRGHQSPAPTDDESEWQVTVEAEKTVRVTAPSAAAARQVAQGEVHTGSLRVSSVQPRLVADGHEREATCRECAWSTSAADADRRAREHHADTGHRVRVASVVGGGEE